MRKHDYQLFNLVAFSLMIVLLSSCGGGGGGESDTGSTTQFSSDDVANRAIANLGSDVEAGTAILMSLAKDNGLTQVVNAIMAGTLDANGNFTNDMARLQASADMLSRLQDICQNPDDEEVCNDEIDDRLMAWEATGLAESLTGAILRASARGYSESQITAAILATILGTSNGGGIGRDGFIFVCDPVDGCFRLDPSEAIVSIFTDVRGDDPAPPNIGGTTDDSAAGDGQDSGDSDLTISNQWILGEWSASGTQQFQIGNSTTTQNGTFFFRDDGSYVYDYAFSNSGGDSGSSTHNGSWTLSDGTLSILRDNQDDNCSGSAPVDSTSLSLSCSNQFTTQWSITLTR